MAQGPGSWWTLPGPHRLVEAVADDLDQGRCVVVRLPQNLPRGFYEAIAQQLAWCSSQPQRWRQVAPLAFTGDTDDDLLDWLYGRFELENEDFVQDKSFGHLCCQPAFQGSRVLLQQLPAAAASLWCRFLLAYQHELQNHQLINRTTFLLILEGSTTSFTPTPDANLAVHSYGEHTTVDDTRLLLRFASAGSAASNEPLLVRHLRHAIAVALAPADPMLALRLVQQSLATLLQPLAYLDEYARSCGWEVNPDALALPEPSPAVAAALWATGSWARLESRPYLHSALWALHARIDQLQSRILEGQLAVLLPFLEQRRHCLLLQYKSELEGMLPHTKKVGNTPIAVHELAELELGDLYYLRKKPELVQNASFDTEVTLLRNCRNELAHQRPIKEECINQLANL